MTILSRLVIITILTMGYGCLSAETRRDGKRPPPAGQGQGPHDRPMPLPPPHDPVWDELGLTEAQKGTLDDLFARLGPGRQPGQKGRGKEFTDEELIRDENEPPPMRKRPPRPRQGPPPRGRRGPPQDGRAMNARHQEWQRAVETVLTSEQYEKLRQKLRERRRPERSGTPDGGPPPREREPSSTTS